MSPTVPSVCYTESLSVWGHSEEFVPHPTACGCHMYHLLFVDIELNLSQFLQTMGHKVERKYYQVKVVLCTLIKLVKMQATL